MGCVEAKVQNAPTVDKRNLGNGIPNSTTASRPGSVGGPAAEDPRLPLTQRDIFRLSSSWKAIHRNLEETGVEMFVRLFKSNAELKTMFHAFKDLDSEDAMRSNEALENHATLVMTTLDDAFTHIDNFDYVSEVLKKTGGTHVRFEGFKQDNFMKIREPFLEAVKITLGDRYTENMESIYKVAITYILQTLCDGMEEAINKQANNSNAKDINTIIQAGEDS